MTNILLIKQHTLTLFFSLFNILVHSFFGTRQGIEVTGRFLCNGKPLIDTPIQLMEEDVFSNDILARGKTDRNGIFSLYGFDYEFSLIDPFIAFKVECPKEKHFFDNKTINMYVPVRAFKYFRRHYEFFFDFGKYEVNNITNQDIYI
uniref:Transthyretin-like family-containing protein n=1 Tax=Strongyloides papillosus TaxID=174720 RepID=A0A0N5BVN2_STREA